MPILVGKELANLDHDVLPNDDLMAATDISGYDAVRFAQSGQLVPGKREHGVFYRDRIFLFADETALQQFGAQPDQFVALVEQAQQTR